MNSGLTSSIYGLNISYDDDIVKISGTTSVYRFSVHNKYKESVIGGTSSLYGFNISYDDDIEIERENLTLVRFTISGNDTLEGYNPPAMVYGFSIVTGPDIIEEELETIGYRIYRRRFVV
jgi:hypothetical protein